MESEEIERILQRCERRMAGHGRKAMLPHLVLAELATTVGPEDEADSYGHGKLISEFEAEVAELLGKESAVFMPSGTMCQQIALRIHAERRKCFTVAFHPRCHLEVYEEDAYRRLHNLNSVLVGNEDRLITLQDLEGIREPVAALLLELPQREIGGQLPEWDDLCAQIAWARERDVATHLDGARLWESQPFYGRSYAEICALFDTVYVSFYKVLGGIAGAILAGPADLIRESRVWQRRHGGNLVQMYPYVLSAKRGLAIRLERIPDYCARARAIADAVRPLPGVEVKPDPPHTNMMYLYFQGDRSEWEDAALKIADETGIFMFGGPMRLQPTAVPGWSRLELSVGDAALDITDEEIHDVFRRLLEA